METVNEIFYEYQNHQEPRTKAYDRYFRDKTRLTLNLTDCLSYSICHEFSDFDVTKARRYGSEFNLINFLSKFIILIVALWGMEILEFGSILILDFVISRMF